MLLNEKLQKMNKDASYHHTKGFWRGVAVASFIWSGIVAMALLL